MQQIAAGSDYKVCWLQVSIFLVTAFYIQSSDALTNLTLVFS